MTAPYDDGDFDVTFVDAGDVVSLTAHYGARIDADDCAAAAQIGGALAERFAAGIQAYCGTPLFGTRAFGVGAGSLFAVSRFTIGTCDRPAELHIAPAAVDRAVSALFGAVADAGEVAGERPRLTEVDRHVLARLVDVFEAALAEVTKSHARLACKRIESSHDMLPRGDADAGQWLAIAFAAADHAPDVQLLLPRQVVRMLLKAGPGERNPADPLLWRRRLHDAALGIELPLTCVVAEPELSLGRLLGLATGDMLPLEQTGGVRVDVAGLPVAAAQPGEQDGRRAVQITALGSVQAAAQSTGKMK